MRKVSIVVSLAMLCLSLQGVAVAGPAASRSTAELQKSIAAGKKTIVFFQNPMGGPCRAQNEIIQKLLKDRKNNFTVAYVSTMKPEDQRAFYDYGVRSLPTVVLVDKQGTIATFFPPGIQSYQTLSAALDAIK